MPPRKRGKTSRRKTHISTLELDSDTECSPGVEANYQGGCRVPTSFVPVAPVQSSKRKQTASSSKPTPHPEPVLEEPSAPQDQGPGQSSRWKKTSQAMKEFMERSPHILDALFSLEVNFLVETPCGCGQEGQLRTTRCTDCSLQSPLCDACMRHSHTHTPFHRVEKWNGQYFRRWSLRKCGLQLCLGHDGARCPCAADSHPTLILIDTNGIHRLQIVYCRCAGAKPEAYQLLLSSLYPATWDSPRTAFTIRVLKHYRLDSLQSRKPAYDYWALLRRLTDNTRAEGVLPDRYEELLRVSREWRYLMRLKQSGQASNISKFLPNESTSVAILCPACPQPGLNMPTDWEQKLSPSNVHQNALYLGMDGNFRAVVVQKPHDEDDIPLLDGRGYFTNSIENASYEENAEDDPNEHNSTCSNLRSMNSYTKRPGIVVTGIIAVVCVRHSLYRPNSIVDMKLGEKFCLNDFALAGALGQSPEVALPRFLLCDKGCQYSVRLHERFSNSFPELAPIVENMTVLVNKMHLQGHKEDCRFRFSPQYTVACGRTDGEGVERPWAHSNETAKITKDQNPGHRKDTFDDTNGDWNYRKVISMATSLVGKLREEIEKKEDAEMNFDVINSGIKPELIAAWENLPTEAWLENGVWRSVYRADQAKVPKRAELVAALTRQEEAEARALGNLDFEKSFCSTTFIDTAINIETKQSQLREFKASLPKPSSRDQQMQLCLKRSQLRDDITSFHLLQAIHMPVLGSAPGSDDFSAHVDEDFGCPEDEPLSLPSDWASAEDRKRLGFFELGEREYLLRRSAADKALANMKIAIQAANSALTFKQRNVRGYGPTTRAEESVQSNFKKIQKHAAAYRRHYLAMKSLGIPKDESSRYQPLTDDDLKHLHISATKSAQLGESQLPQGWFWAGDRDADVPKNKTSLDELSQEEQRVRWFRARAHRDRCREEVEILEAELERTAASFRRLCVIWQEVASIEGSHDLPDGQPSSVQCGRRAYALKQAAIHGQRALQAEECIKQAQMLLARQVVGKKRNVAGAVKEQEDAGIEFEWSYF